MENRVDKHHVLWNKREWESRPPYWELRENSGLLVPMDREVHNELHRNIPFVPVIGYHAIMAVRREFHQGDTHLETVDNLMFAMESAAEHPRASDIEKKLTLLALEAVDLQRPYIIEGQIENITTGDMHEQ